MFLLSLTVKAPMSVSSSSLRNYRKRFVFTADLKTRQWIYFSILDIIENNELSIDNNIISYYHLAHLERHLSLVHLEHKKSETSWHLPQEFHIVQHWPIMVRDRRSNFYSNFQPRVERLLAHLEQLFRHKRSHALLKKKERIENLNGETGSG